MGVGGWRTTKTEVVGIVVLWVVSGHAAWELIAWIVTPLNIGWQ